MLITSLFLTPEEAEASNARVKLWKKRYEKEIKSLTHKNMAQKLKVGDKIKIRKVEFEILSDKRGKQQYYFLSQGARQLLKDLGITSHESTSMLDARGGNLCKEDEYKLANKFSRVPAVLVGNNPVRANSLVKLQEFIDYVKSVSDTIKETKAEKDERKWLKRNRKQMRRDGRFGGPFGFGGKDRKGEQEAEKENLSP
jgi:hypothetical protein